MSSSWKPQAVVLGPGGVKAFLEIGSLICLENKDILSNVKQYVGVSAGAILSYLLILGYTLIEIIDICLQYDVFPDVSNITISSIMQNHGLMSQNSLENILNTFTVKKFGMLLTMEQLYIATGIEFTVVSVNIGEKRYNHTQNCYIDRHTEPDLNVVKAVLYSCNIPGLFHKQVHAGKVLIDGALGNPYPVNICDDGKKDVIGIYIQEKIDDEESPENSVFKYLERIIIASMIELRIQHIEKSSDKCKHIQLVGYSLDPVGFTTSEEEKYEMVIRGYEQTCKWLSENIA